jgi:small subunit ribosomal protein S6
LRTYELVFIADPRLSDEEVVALADEYKGMIIADGNTKITKEESWGRRKLAYPINKLSEGRYHIFYIEGPKQNTLPEVEQRLRQNDKILRHLVIRTDEDLKRAASKGKEPPQSEANPSAPQEAAPERSRDRDRDRDRDHSSSERQRA